jgi:hypothetical protein
MKTEISSAREKSHTEPQLAEIKVMNFSTPQSERTMTSTRAKDPLMTRLMRWICPDQRVANRHSMPPVIAYLGLVHNSKEYRIGDISVAGFYMLTEERWIPGTGLPITLERTDEAGMGQTLTMHPTVVRVGEDGVAFTFITPSDQDGDNGDTQAKARLDLTKLAQFLKGLPLSDSSTETLERTA